jgi:hypothetical protein
MDQSRIEAAGESGDGIAALHIHPMLGMAGQVPAGRQARVWKQSMYAVLLLRRIE